MIRLEYRLVDSQTDHEFASGSVNFHPDAREPQRIYEGATYLFCPYTRWIPSDIAVFRGIEMKADFHKPDSWTRAERSAEPEEVQP